MESDNRLDKGPEAQADLFEFHANPERQVTPWTPPSRRKESFPGQWLQDWDRFRERVSGKWGEGLKFNGKKWPIPWTRIILLGLTVYVLTFKDLQFSLDMKAPLGPTAPPPSEGLAPPTQSIPTAAAVPQEEEEDIQAYMDRFQKVALAEMQKYGIPASIKMAQALLESQAGRSQDARTSNNHFGTPLAGRVFNSAWANWRAHSELLKKEYPELFRQGMHYKAWAKGLEKAGYNPRRGYADQLIRLIETYRLFEWDDH